MLEKKTMESPFATSEEYVPDSDIADKPDQIESGILNMASPDTQENTLAVPIYFKNYDKYYSLFHVFFTLLVIVYMRYSFSARSKCKHVYIDLCIA